MSPHGRPTGHTAVRSTEVAKMSPHGSPKGHTAVRSTEVHQ